MFGPEGQRGVEEFEGTGVEFNVWHMYTFL